MTTTEATRSVPGERALDRVELRVPADPQYLAVLRTASAGLAARLDLTLDEIEDLRIAVDEACALLLGGGAPSGGEQLEARFDLAEGQLAVYITGPAREMPPRTSFAWAVLEALAGEVESGLTDTGAWIRLHHTSSRTRL